MSEPNGSTGANHCDAGCSSNVTSAPDLDDRVLEDGLRRYLRFTGQGGMNNGRSLQERRRMSADLAAKAQSKTPIRRHVSVTNELVEIPDRKGNLRLRIYRRSCMEVPAPAVIYIHGGGMLLGSPEEEDHIASAITDEIGCVTVSVDYRLAPEHPYPAAIEDCYAGLTWVVGNSASLGIDPDRIALFGRSAGGGLAAGTSLLARDRSGPPIAFQMLIYPMLDDRNDTPSSLACQELGVWDRRDNSEAWSMVLRDVTCEQVPVYASPGRVTDSRFLPSTFIDTGGRDLFRDEDVAFAHGLMRDGVPTELHVYPNAYHAFDEIAPTAPVSIAALDIRTTALKRALWNESTSEGAGP